MALQLTRRRFTVDEYHQMAEAGILREDDRVELIDGEIVEMSPIGGWHVLIVTRLTHLLVVRFGDIAWVSVQNPVRLGDDLEPQPDVAVVRPRAGNKSARVTEAAEVFVVIEVADTTLAYDRDVKMPRYIRAGIPEAWLIDQTSDAVIIHREPRPNGYRTVRVAQRGEQIAPLAFPDRPIAVADILG